MTLIAGNCFEKIDQVPDRPLVTENTKKLRCGEPGFGRADRPGLLSDAVLCQRFDGVEPAFAI